MSGVTLAITVGSKKSPPRLWRLPPRITFAPLFKASATCASTFFTPFSSISGPITTPGSLPAPTLKPFTFSASFAAKAS